MKYIHKLRFTEAFLMTGFFMVSAFFATPHFRELLQLNTILVFGAVYSLILAVYSFNALCGHSADRHNLRLNFMNGTSPRFFSVFFFAGLTGAIVLTALINPFLLYYVLAISVLWIWYSIPVVGLKNHPFTGSLLHFLAELIHFQMVYAVFAPVGLFSFLVSVYFALLFAAGHLHHEVIDADADKKARLRTTAVVFGKARTLLFSNLVFTFAAIYAAILGFTGTLSVPETLCLILPYVVHMGVYVKMKAAMALHSDKQLLYRKIYRIAYMVGCLGLIGVRFF